MNKLIIVTDLCHLKAYRVTREVMSEPYAIELIHENTFEEYHPRMSERMSDRAGHFPGGVGHPGMGYGEEHHEAEEMRKQQLHRLAQEIAGIMREEKSEFVYFAALQTIYHTLRQLLPMELQAHLTKEVEADLVKLPKADLLKRFNLS